MFDGWRQWCKEVFARKHEVDALKAQVDVLRERQDALSAMLKRYDERTYALADHLKVDMIEVKSERHWEVRKRAKELL
jgi:hypothetical protein